MPFALAIAENVSPGCTVTDARGADEPAEAIAADAAFALDSLTVKSDTAVAREFAGGVSDVIPGIVNGT
jgi:hypothetical protein